MINNWKLVVLERYAKFDGRAGRGEYWWFILANFILVNLLVIVLLAMFVWVDSAVADALGYLVGLALLVFWLGTIVPSIAVGVRRLHDTNKSGWLMLILLAGVIPIVNFVVTILFIVFMATAGDPGPNQYGASAEPAG